MNTIKNHLSLILALISMLIAIQSVISLNKMIKEYQNELTNNYSLVVVASVELNLAKLQTISPYINRFAAIDSNTTISALKGNLSSANIALLKVSLPKFYRLHLDHYPSASELSKIESKLIKNRAITRVESFAKSHNQLYELLMLSKGTLLLFSTLIFFIAILLIIRQMEVWRFRHSERMSIMAIFGAPLWMRSAVLYRLAIIDSILSTLFVAFLFVYLTTDLELQMLVHKIGLQPIEFSLLSDTPLLFGVAMCISVFSVIFVIMKTESES
jgi:cell division transport system permease protein